jgi:hypothetical protein
LAIEIDGNGQLVTGHHQFMGRLRISDIVKSQGWPAFRTISKLSTSHR